MKKKSSLVNAGTVAKALKEADKIGKDFEPLYRASNWTWGDSACPPCAGEISNQIKRMIRELVVDFSGYGYITTAGLEVRFCGGDYEEDEGDIKISFVRDHHIYKIGK